MTYYEISCLTPINDVDEDKVNTLVASMLENGWQGCPILVWGDQPLTGSHLHRRPFAKSRKWLTQMRSRCPRSSPRMWPKMSARLPRRIYNKFAEENGWEKDIDFADIGWLLAGSWAGSVQR